MCGDEQEADGAAAPVGIRLSDAQAMAHDQLDEPAARAQPIVERAEERDAMRRSIFRLIARSLEHSPFETFFLGRSRACQ